MPEARPGAGAGCLGPGPDFAAIYRHDGMDGHAAVEQYTQDQWGHLSEPGRADFADGMLWALRLVAASPEVLGPLAVAIHHESLVDPLLPREPEEWDAVLRIEAAALIARWDRDRKEVRHG